MQKWYALYVSLYSYLIEKKVCGPDMQSGRAYWAVSSHLASRKSIRQLKMSAVSRAHLAFQISKRCMVSYILSENYF